MSWLGLKSGKRAARARLAMGFACGVMLVGADAIVIRDGERGGASQHCQRRHAREQEQVSARFSEDADDGGKGHFRSRINLARCAFTVSRGAT